MKANSISLIILEGMKKITGNSRMAFFPSISSKYVHLENTLYNTSESLSKSYGGGFWDFYANQNGVKIPVARGDDMLECANPMNYAEGELHPVYFSIVSWLIAMSRHAPMVHSERLADAFENLQDWLYHTGEKLDDYIANAKDEESKKAFTGEREQVSRALAFLD